MCEIERRIPWKIQVVMVHCIGVVDNMSAGHPTDPGEVDALS